MHVTEQGIGTERLEKLRRAADKGHKIKKRAAWIALALVIVWRIWANRYRLRIRQHHADLCW